MHVVCLWVIYPCLPRATFVTSKALQTFTPLSQGRSLFKTLVRHVILEVPACQFHSTVILGVGISKPRMGLVAKPRTCWQKYYTHFERILSQQGILAEPGRVDGHPVLAICFGFTSFELTNRQANHHVSFKETRVDRMVREVFQSSDLYQNLRGDASGENETLVDGFPVSFWLGFENPMLAVLFSVRHSRKHNRFSFTKKHKRVRRGELRWRQRVEGEILTSTMILVRNSASFSSSDSSFDISDLSSDSGQEDDGRRGSREAYTDESDTNSDTEAAVVNERRTERFDHMDDGTVGPYLGRFPG